MNHKMSSARAIAFGGIFAALAVVFMSVGGLIPVATYVCPMLCVLILQFILQTCGISIAWAWYGVVAILSVMLSPDKEAAAVFLFLGYYPILKRKLDPMRFGMAWKIIYFNAVIFVLYWLLLQLIGLPELVKDFDGMGMGMLILLVLLGNISFILLDRVLTMDLFRKLRNNGK